MILPMTKNQYGQVHNTGSAFWRYHIQMNTGEGIIIDDYLCDTCMVMYMAVQHQNFTELVSMVGDGGMSSLCGNAYCQHFETMVPSDCQYHKISMPFKKEDAANSVGYRIIERHPLHIGNGWAIQKAQQRKVCSTCYEICLMVWGD